MVMEAMAIVAMEGSVASGLVDINHDGTHITSNISAAVLLISRFTDLDGYHQFQQPMGPFEKTLTGARLEIGEGDLSGVEFYVAVKQRLSDDTVWQGPFDVEDDGMIHLLGVEDGRYFAFKISQDNPIAIWQIDALELFGSVGEGQV
jgi:hypothetical protein